LILGLSELQSAWKSKRIVFSPDIESDQIGLSSIDLRLGYEFSKLQAKRGITINPSSDDFDPKGLFTSEDYSKPDKLGRRRTFELDTNEFVVAFTLEEVRLPNDLAASIEGRSRLARYGLSVHTTAPHIHPAWVGHIALELYNHGPIPIQLQPGADRVCHLIFHEVKSPVPAEVAKSIGTFVRQKGPYQKPK